MRRVFTATVLLLSITLAMAALNLSGCGEDEANPVIPKGTPTRKVVVAADNFFDPRHVSIAQGDTIVWFNAGSMGHTTTSGSGGIADGTWNSGSSNPSQYMQPGDRFVHIFTDSVGVYPYFCEPHAGMTGTVTVTP